MDELSEMELIFLRFFDFWTLNPPSDFKMARGKNDPLTEMNNKASYCKSPAHSPKELHVEGRIHIFS